MILMNNIEMSLFKVVDKIHYLHFGLILWGISGIVTVNMNL